MTIDVHSRARLLIDKSLLTDLSQEEDFWLRDHLAACADCEKSLNLSKSVLHALGEFSFSMIPGASSRIQHALLRRAAEIEVYRSFRSRALVGCALGLLLTALGSLVAWESASSIASYVNIREASLHTGVVVFWLLPSVGASLILLLAPYLIRTVDQKAGRI
jgi:hypothetical protein